MVESATSLTFGSVGELVKHRCFDQGGVEENRLSGSNRREALKEMSKIATKVWTPSSMKRALISLHEECLRKNVTVVFGSVHYCYVERVPVDLHVSLVQVPTQAYEGYGVDKYGLAHK